MNRNFLIGCLVILMIFTGCKKKKSVDSLQKENNVILDSTSKSKAALPLLTLSQEAVIDLENFEDFQKLQKLMKTMKTVNPFYIKKYADSTSYLVRNFKDNIAGSPLNINTINSRINVLDTEVSLLAELKNKETPDPDALMDANTRLITAYNSLIIQLNEMSLGIPENIEKELLKDNELKKDSVTLP